MKDYAEKVKAQESAAQKPFLKALCVTRTQREMIMDFMKEVKLYATKYGPYELTKTEGKRDYTTRSSGQEQKSKWVQYKGGMKDLKKQGGHLKNNKENKDWKGYKKFDHRPPAKGGQDSKRWMTGGGTQKIICFKCGQSGHNLVLVSWLMSKTTLKIRKVKMMAKSQYKSSNLKVNILMLKATEPR